MFCEWLGERPHTGAYTEWPKAKRKKKSGDDSKSDSPGDDDGVDI
jgi:hypothetical protein